MIFSGDSSLINNMKITQGEEGREKSGERDLIALRSLYTVKEKCLKRYYLIVINDKLKVMVRTQTIGSVFQL